jgi:predicted ATPase with chaperone activity
VLRVARTIADLSEREHVAVADLDEAISYRLVGWEQAAA